MRWTILLEFTEYTSRQHYFDFVPVKCAFLKILFLIDLCLLNVRSWRFCFCLICACQMCVPEDFVSAWFVPVKCVFLKILFLLELCLSNVCSWRFCFCLICACQMYVPEDSIFCLICACFSHLSKVCSWRFCFCYLKLCNSVFAMKWNVVDSALENWIDQLLDVTKKIAHLLQTRFTPFLIQLLLKG